MRKPKLFCFTYAGGTASFFDVIEKNLEGIELLKMEYAGHGTRYRESFYKSFSELADDMFDQTVRQIMNGRYALFGYSMGCISVVEVLKRIINSNQKPPDHVFLAAHEPETKTDISKYSSDELDERVKERIIQFNEVPEKLLNNKTFWRTYLPIYRADYELIGNYHFEELELMTTIPCTVFFSPTDTLRNDMEEWRKYFTGFCDFQECPGKHFFIREHHIIMADIIKDKMIYDI